MRVSLIMSVEHIGARVLAAGLRLFGLLQQLDRSRHKRPPLSPVAFASPHIALNSRVDAGTSIHDYPHRCYTLDLFSNSNIHGDHVVRSTVLDALCIIQVSPFRLPVPPCYLAQNAALNNLTIIVYPCHPGDPQTGIFQPQSPLCDQAPPGTPSSAYQA